MPKPKMTKSLQMIASYKEHAHGDEHRRIDRLAKMYERYEIPSRKTVLNICKALSAWDEQTRAKGRLMYLKYAKPQLYNIFSPSDDEQEQEQDEDSDDWSDATTRLARLASS